MMSDNEEEKDMNAAINHETIKKSLSDNPKFQQKVPRLNVSEGKAQIDSDYPLHRKWFEEFKK
ncbi:hypothetical protein [Paenibacillus sp. FSL H8-0537]|uniref:hypothetical protein n=1 Tax=Paenibacillus sp. FSL H8-0537 TaxID=2921399 RepID=UPI003101A134